MLQESSRFGELLKANDKTSTKMNNGPLSLILWMDSQRAILFIWFNLYYNSSFKNYLFFILFERQRDRYFPLANSLSKHVQQPELGWFKARILELYPGLSWGWWEPKYLSHDLLPPKMCISKGLGGNGRPWTGTRHSHRWCGHPKWRHHGCTVRTSYNSFFMVYLCNTWYKVAVKRQRHKISDLF